MDQASGSGSGNRKLERFFSPQTWIGELNVGMDTDVEREYRLSGIYTHIPTNNMYTARHKTGILRRISNSSLWLESERFRPFLNENK